MDSAEKSAVKNFLIRPLGMLLSLVYTPLLLNYLGTEANGVWATMLSVITWINYFDLGVGNGLRNLLAKELARKDLNAARASISTAYIVLGGISAVILVVLAVLAYVVDWNIILGTDLEVQLMVIITFVYIAVNFFLSLSNSILYAMQKSEQVSIRNCLTQALNIIFLLILGLFSKGSLVYIAVLFGTTTTIVYLYTTFQIFRKNRGLNPDIRLFEKGKIGEITGFGLQFFVVQLCSLLVLSSHNFLIATWFGAEAVTPVNIATNLFATIYSFFGALVVPFWSRTTEALVRCEIQWVKNTIKRVLYIACLFVAILLVAAVLFEPLTEIWLGKKLDYQPGTIITTCLIYCVQTIQVCFTQFYFGMGKIKSYVFLTVVQAVIMIPLSNLFSNTMNMGPAGVKLAAVLLIAVATLSLVVMTFRRLNKLQNTATSK